MIDFILNFLPRWLALPNTPMSPKSRQMWDKIRRVGFVPFVLLFTFGLGGTLALLDISWDMCIGHQAIGGLQIAFYVVWWLSGGLVVAIGEWYLNERRLQLPPKSASALESSKYPSRMWVP
jgi:hypothetical protein